jgi:hypothetical protein
MNLAKAELHLRHVYSLVLLIKIQALVFMQALMMLTPSSISYLIKSFKNTMDTHLTLNTSQI